MAMEFKLTHANLQQFIETAHTYLYKAPEKKPNQMEDAVDRCNSFIDLIDRINCLLWHDTSEFRLDDKIVEPDIEIINKAMKEMFRDRFFTMAKKGSECPTAGWTDPKKFAEANVDIWTTFIPGYVDPQARICRMRGNQLEQWKVVAEDLRIGGLIVPQLENVADLMMAGGSKPHVTRLMCLYSELVFSSHNASYASNCLFDVIKAQEDVDESMLDEYFAFHSDMIDVLHKERNNEFVADSIYQIASAVALMMITDSMIATASFKLGEYVTDLHTQDQPCEVVNTNGLLKANEDEFPMGRCCCPSPNHKFVTLTRELLRNAIAAAISEADPDHDPDDGPDYTISSECDFLSEALTEVLNRLHPGVPKGSLEALKQYLTTRIIDPDRKMQPLLCDAILDEIELLLPRTMADAWDKKGKEWTFDLGLYEAMASYMDVLVRKLINQTYVTREMGYNPGYDDSTREGYEYMATELVQNTLVIAFDNQNYRELVECYFMVNHTDPLNMGVNTINEIIRIAIPTCGVAEIRHVDPNAKRNIHPEMNFPPIDPPVCDEHDVSQLPTYDFIYRIDNFDAKIDRFIVNPYNVADVIKSLIDRRPASIYRDLTIMRILFPHAQRLDDRHYSVMVDAVRAINEKLRAPTEDMTWVAIQSIIPYWKLPEPNLWHSEERNGPQVLSLNAINHTVNNVYREIVKKYGANTSESLPRPVGAIVREIYEKLYDYEVVTDHVSTPTTTREILEGMLMKLLATHIVDRSDERLIGNYTPIVVPPEFIDTISMDTDLKDLDIPDPDLVSIMFKMIVHMIPFDDMSMREAFEPKTTSTDSK